MGYRMFHLRSRKNHQCLFGYLVLVLDSVQVFNFLVLPCGSEDLKFEFFVTSSKGVCPTGVT
jgi:hypothetical protein